MNTLLNLTKKAVLLAALTISFSVTAQLSEEKSYKESVNNKNEERKKHDLIFVDENGKNISLSEMKGKVVFINFWATWCAPCVEEMPTIAELKNKFKGNDKIVFILLNVEADLKKSKKFMADRKLDLPVYLSGSTIPSELFQGAIPTTLIFDKNGDLEANIQGARNFANPELYQALNEMTKN